LSIFKCRRANLLQDFGDQRYNSDKERVKRSFFRRHLSINKDSLLLHQKQVRFGIGRDDNGNLVSPELFDVYIWTLKVVNKYPAITKSVTGCNAELFVSSITPPLQLIWKTKSNEPSDIVYQVTESTDHRKELLKRLGDNFIDGLILNGSTTINISKGESKELYLLLASAESDFGFIITNGGSMKWYKDVLARRVDNQLLLFHIPKNGELPLRYRLEINLNNEKMKRFDLVISSYSKIDLYPIPFYR